MAQAIPNLVDDATELTHRVWELLKADCQDMQLADVSVQPLPAFLDDADQHRTSPADRQTILDQALLLFDLYPHLPFKTEIYKLGHPADYIRAKIQPNLDSLSETDFHSEMIDAFALVRDCHTVYGLPSPYRGAVAFLPFEIRPYLDLRTKAGWRFIVTSVMDSNAEGGFGHKFFGTGAEIVKWGDQSTLAHVQDTEKHLPGGNYFASFARGARHCTFRPLRFVRPPEKDERPAAKLHYRPEGSDDIRTILLPWAVAKGFGPDDHFPDAVFSMNPAMAVTSAWGTILHHRSDLKNDQKAGATKDPKQVSSIPDIFDFQYTTGVRRKGFINLVDLVSLNDPDARFGYIRIKSFSNAFGSTQEIVTEFARILKIMDTEAPDGLVLDIRNNSGGDVRAAEQMLQMLTARTIQTAPFHLANTKAVLDILRRLKSAANDLLAPGAQLSTSERVSLQNANASLENWLDVVQTNPWPDGPPLTTGFPLTDPDSANDTGQIYQGRGVALLMNSLTYSAADIFAAGFQDHWIGPLLGTSLLTGGGGADVWSHEQLLDKIGLLGMGLKPLPSDPNHPNQGVTMGLAIRRCSRVGRFNEQPVEDRGVRADVYYRPSNVEDLIFGNRGILGRACAELRRRHEFRVAAGVPAALPNGDTSVDVQTNNIDTLKFYLNDKLALTAPAGGGAKQNFTVPAVGSSSPSSLRIEGYASGPLADSGFDPDLDPDPNPAPDPDSGSGTDGGSDGALHLVRAQRISLVRDGPAKGPAKGAHK